MNKLIELNNKEIDGVFGSVGLYRCVASNEYIDKYFIFSENMDVYYDNEKKYYCKVALSDFQLRTVVIAAAVMYLGIGLWYVNKLKQD